MTFKNVKILIVDDEEDLCEILQFNLESEGYKIDLAYSAEEALKKPLESFNLLLLDVMMGKMSGFKLAEKLRKGLNIKTPIIFITAKDTENDILTGFNLGADDYISKPFSVKELSARVKAVLRRAEALKTNKPVLVKEQGIELDDEKKRVLINNKKTDLTRKEFELLKLFLGNQGKMFNRDELLTRIWDDQVIVNERTVDVNITRLRKKLDNYGKFLKNKTGYGYYWEFE